MSKYKVGQPYPISTNDIKRIWESQARNHIHLFEIRNEHEDLDWVSRESLRELAELKLNGYVIIDGGTKDDAMKAYDKVMDEYFND